MRHAMAFACAVLATGPLTAAAQPYPSKPVHLVVPQPPGGPTDAIGRLFGAMLADGLGQNVVVENRVGAGGTIGTTYVARSKPDGYTLLVATAGVMSIAPYLFTKVDYDPMADFQHVSLLTKTVTVLVVHPSFPAKSVAELIRIARAKPGQINIANGGNGTVSHLTGELFKSMAGIDIVHVPYGGSGPAATAVMGGQVEIFFLILNEGIEHVRSGRLRALATTGAERAKHMPQVPTVAEAGVKGFESVTWYGLSAPAGLAADVSAKLSAASTQGLKKSPFRERYDSAGMELVGSTPENFVAHIRAENAKWSKVITQSGAKVN